MKPFKQGNLDRFCSVYSVLNSMQLLGINLPYYKAQEMYDYIIRQRMEPIIKGLNKLCRMPRNMSKPFSKRN